MTILKDEKGRRIDENGNLMAPHAPLGERPGVLPKDEAAIRRREEMKERAEAPPKRREPPPSDIPDRPPRPVPKSGSQMMQEQINLLAAILAELRKGCKCK